MAIMSETLRDADLLATLGDFTSKENWDKFFTLRGCDELFESYVEWRGFQRPLISELSHDTSLQIILPGCGNSRISEYLYHIGFICITNIDFSEVVVSDRLRKRIRSRSAMRWRVMDMTNMQDTYFIENTQLLPLIPNRKKELILSCTLLSILGSRKQVGASP